MVVPQSGVTEYVGPSKACPTMFAAKPAADRRFSRVNCWGELETRVSVVLVAWALRPPPCPRSMSWGGPLAVAEVAELWFSNHGSSTVTVNVALLRQLERCRTATVVPLRLKRRAGSLEGSTNDAARMAGPGRICFAPLDFLFSFCSPMNYRAPFMQSRKGGSSAKFF
jgi:hypothetical protein